MTTAQLHTSSSVMFQGSSKPFHFAACLQGFTGKSGVWETEEKVYSLLNLKKPDTGQSFLTPPVIHAEAGATACPSQHAVCVIFLKTSKI